MKLLKRYITLAVVAAALAGLSTAWAGECCKAAAEKTKKGESCSNCEEHACCKAAAKKVEESGESKECQKCAAKKDGDKEG